MKLSILTINLNNKNGLEKTMNSVFEQSFSDYEFIVVDGGSTDGSKELIHLNASRINNWVSEKDTGIYNAMNKAIKMAKGEYCFFLNSGDCFVNADVLSKVLNINVDSDVFSGNVLKVRSNGNWNLVKSHEQVSLHKLMRASIPHQGSFIKRYLFDIVGYYTESYRIVSDWEFFLKALIIHKYSYKHIEMDIAYFMLDGISSQKTSKELARKESIDCIENNFFDMKDDLIEYRYFYNSYIGVMYEQLVAHPKLYSIVEKFCEKLLNTKKWIFRK